MLSFSDTIRHTHSVSCAENCGGKSSRMSCPIRATRQLGSMQVPSCFITATSLAVVWRRSVSPRNTPNSAMADSSQCRTPTFRPRYDPTDIADEQGRFRRKCIHTCVRRNPSGQDALWLWELGGVSRPQSRSHHRVTCGDALCVIR
jgi:hypothetical protein